MAVNPIRLPEPYLVTLGRLLSVEEFQAMPKEEGYKEAAKQQPAPAAAPVVAAKSAPAAQPAKNTPVRPAMDTDDDAWGRYQDARMSGEFAYVPADYKGHEYR